MSIKNQISWVLLDFDRFSKGYLLYSNLYFTEAKFSGTISTLTTYGVCPFEFWYTVAHTVYKQTHKRPVQSSTSEEVDPVIQVCSLQLSCSRIVAGLRGWAWALNRVRPPRSWDYHSFVTIGGGFISSNIPQTTSCFGKARVYETKHKLITRYTTG